ncbi:MAG: ABC transporter permease subunit [Phycisphaerales bacterium]
MQGWLPVLRRELTGYFVTPVAYVFIVIFLILAGVFTFQFGGFYTRGQADLASFFNFHPWLYLFLIPAVSMRLWAEEHKSGTTELLMTLPITRLGAVVGKFLAAWLFTILALALTFPIWISVNVLGDPDNGVIFFGYIGSMLMAGGFLAIGAAVSASTRSQVIAFVITAVICFVLLLIGDDSMLQFVSSWAPDSVVDTISSFSFLSRFEAISRGVIDLRDIIYFGSLIVVFLAINTVALEARKA